MSGRGTPRGLWRRETRVGCEVGGVWRYGVNG